MPEEIINHKHKEGDDIIQMKVFKVPISKENPEGISYSLVYIRNGKRLVGYDNFEGHMFEGKSHHKHIGERVIRYDFVDEWQLLKDFEQDIEKIKRGTIQ